MKTARKGSVEMPAFVRQLVKETEKRVSSFFKGSRGGAGEGEQPGEGEKEEVIPSPYLDRPVLDKLTEEGCARWGLTYALGSMQGWRANMEDFHNCVPQLGGQLADWSFFAVFDGHAGSTVAQHCSQHLLGHILATGGIRPGDDPEKVKSAITEGFLQTDKHLHSVARREGWERGGTTVVATLISPYYIYFANCGDSRAVLCRSGHVCFSTEDHKPYSPLEKERIESAGGSVSLQRINGSLAVSRSLGDFSYKGAENRTPSEQMVSPEPEVCVVERSPADEFLVIACDGVWDTISNEDLCTFIHNRLRVCNDLRDVCTQVIDLCLYKGSLDNIMFKVAERGLVYAAEILLRYGASLNFEDPVSYYNPLHIAVLRNRPNMVRLLVGHGADIEKRDRIHESSPLDLASEESERLPCLLTLLDLGADVNARDKHGKTPLLHALASSDGLTVHNTENIQLLLQRGADVNAATVDCETVASSLVFLVKEALEASTEDAAEIGNFCLKTTQLLLAHGVDPSCCLNEDGEPSLTQTSLEHFDHLFPLAVLLIESGASLVCSCHGYSCWSGYSLLFQRLQTALQQCSDQSHASELLEQAEVLLDLARVNIPTLHLPPRLELPVPGQDPHPYGQALVDLHNRVVEHEASPPALRCLCRVFIRSYLQPWPIEDRVKALPLPDRLKDFLLPEHTYTPKPGWDCFKPQQSQR